MSLWRLFEVASTPILEVLLITGLGAFLATNYCNLLTAHARKSLSKIAFMVFSPSLIFSSLAKTITLEDIISWWYMPINIGFTILIGGILGWILVKLMKPEPHLEGLVIATCSTGNLGNIMLFMVPATCNEFSSAFVDREACKAIAFSYTSFSMALGSFYVWTFAYHLMRSSAAKLNEANNLQTHLLKGQNEQLHEKVSFWSIVSGIIHHIVHELLAPPMVGAIFGFIFGAITFLKNLIIGQGAPLHVIHDSIQLLGNGAIPSITLVLGANLIQGLRSSRMKGWIIVGIICVRYVILPPIGICLVKSAAYLGFLPSDHLFHFVLMLQFALPPASNIGTMAQLFDVGQEECSVLFLWTYLVAALALTFWSTIFMWILF